MSTASRPAAATSSASTVIVAVYTISRPKSTGPRAVGAPRASTLIGTGVAGGALAACSSNAASAESAGAAAGSGAGGGAAAADSESSSAPQADTSTANAASSASTKLFPVRRIEG